MQMLASKFVDANGLKLHYLDCGSEGSPHVVLLHGLNGNAHMYDQVAPHLAAQHHVIALDFRGHGDSQWGPPDGYTPPNYLGDLGAFLKALSIDKAAFVGSSMGGAMAMIFATLAPQIVEKLVLNDIGAEITIDVPDPEQPALTDRRFRTVAEATRFYRDSVQPVSLLPDAAAEKLTADSVKQGADGMFAWKTDPALNSGGGASGASNRVIRMWSFYENVQAPILIVRGGASSAIPPETLKKMVAMHPRTRAIEVPGVGHTPWLNEPAALPVLLDFLQ
jgi:pimeloyl-ACP methyl ester carboxylesterase